MRRCITNKYSPSDRRYYSQNGVKTRRYRFWERPMHILFHLYFLDFSLDGFCVSHFPSSFREVFWWTKKGGLTGSFVIACNCKFGLARGSRFIDFPERSLLKKSTFDALEGNLSGSGNSSWIFWGRRPDFLQGRVFGFTNEERPNCELRWCKSDSSGWWTGFHHAFWFNDLDSSNNVDASWQGLLPMEKSLFESFGRFSIGTIEKLLQINDRLSNRWLRLIDR